MKTTKFTHGALQIAQEPLEALKSQLAKPILEEAVNELGGFFGRPRSLGRNPQEIAREDLQRARDKHKLDQMENQDDKESQEDAQRVSASIKQEYHLEQTRNDREQHQLKEEFAELQVEVSSLAKQAGLETKVPLESAPKKIGVIDIKRLTSIIRFLKVKAEESKSAKELVFQRANAKRTTGMLAWVSGKQMKVYEQGTLQLQG